MLKLGQIVLLLNFVTTEFVCFLSKVLYLLWSVSHFFCACFQNGIWKLIPNEASCYQTKTIRRTEAEIKDSDSQTAGKGEEAAVITELIHLKTGEANSGVLERFRILCVLFVIRVNNNYAITFCAFSNI